MSKWIKEELATTPKAESTIVRIGKPKSGFVEVEMENGDHAQTSIHGSNLKEGDSVEYKIRKYKFTDKDDPDNVFTTNSYIGLKLKGVGHCIRALQGVDPSNIIFVDIETVSVVEKLKKNSDLYESWAYKMERSKNMTDMYELKNTYKEHSTLYPEFSRVFCVSIGRFVDGELKVISYHDDNEEDLLAQAGTILAKYSSKRNVQICGHSVKGFDVPFLMRRMIINGVEVPEILDVSGLKPWEVKLLDTYELWKGSGYNSASLVNITTAMGLPSPKGEITGKDVNKVYWEGEREKIVRYCEQDVLAVANITFKMMGIPTLENYESLTSFKAKDGAEEEE